LRILCAFNPDVERFLRRHSGLIVPLAEAAARISQLFGRAALRLELSDERRHRVFIVIGTDKSPKEAVDLEERLICQWYAPLPAPLQNLLAITEEHLGF
jgi:hypothetical protein